MIQLSSFLIWANRKKSCELPFLDRKNFWRIIDLSVMVEQSVLLNPRISGWSSAENLDF